MQLDVGYDRYSTDAAELVYAFSSLIDYDPASSDLGDAVGEHFYIYKTKGQRFLLVYRVRGQKAFGEPAFTADEGLVPIPDSVARLLIGQPCDNAGDSEQDQGKPFSAIIRDLYDWLGELEPRIDEKVALNEDLKNDLREMVICLNANSFRGCLAMAGVVLERMLKEFLAQRRIDFGAEWMVGRLISAVEESGQYLDPSLKNIWNLINAQRIIGVHAKERAPIPSRDQAIMVAYAVKDSLSRLLSA
jgi:hypothetical protein